MSASAPQFGAAVLDLSDCTEIAFIDPSVPDFSSLVAGVRSNVEVILLNGDGVIQISTVLAQRRQIGAIHIVSHGTPGTILLGTAKLSTSTIEPYARSLMQWARSLGADAEILIYGCEVAQGSQAFLQQMSELTGATIAASVTKTGSAELGGNWQLEVRTGEIRTELAFGLEARSNYRSVLANDPVPVAGTYTAPTNLVNVNGVLYFSASDGNGTELWRINPTTGQAALVRNIAAGSLNSSPTNLTNVNGVLYFTANDGVNGVELWKVDSPTGTASLVGNINAGGNAAPEELININGTLYFSADDGASRKLWKVDPTGQLSVVASATAPSYSDPESLVNVNGTLYFVARDTTNGIELWRLDANGEAQLVDNIRSGIASSTPRNLTNVNGILYFSAAGTTTPATGAELWKFDTIALGAVPTLVRDIRGGSTGSSLSNFTNINGTLYFTANDGTNGVELWRIDANGQAELVSNINPTGNSNPQLLTNVNGTLYFRANDGVNGLELWKIDANGQAALVRNIHTSGDSDPRSLVNVDGTLYFSATNGSAANGVELWKVDPLSGQALLVKDIRLGGTGSDVDNLANVNGTLYFSANSGSGGDRLWRLDPPTPLTLDLNGASAGSNFAAAFIENGATVSLASNTLAITNSDNQIDRATITIVNFVAGQDELLFTDQNDISGTFTNAVLTLTGTTTIANYRTALSSIQYRNSSDNPNTIARDIQFVLFDDVRSSPIVTTTLSITATNDAPLLNAPATQGFDSNASTAIAGISIADVDANSTIPLNVTVSAGTGTLSLGTQNGITVVSGNGTTNVQSFEIRGSLSDLNTALASLSYRASSNTVDTLSITVNDNGNGANGSNPLTATRSIQLRPPLTLDLNGASPGSNFATSFTENGSATLTSSNLTITNFDNDIDGATITIANFVAGQDELLFTNQNGISGTFNNGILALTGTTTIANYENALKSIAYRNLSDNPNTTSREIQFVVNDGAQTSVIATTKLNITAVNDAPTLSVPGFQNVNTNSSTAISGISIADIDANNAIPLTVTVAVGTGTLIFGTTNGLTVVPGNSGQSFQLSGSLNNLNAALASLSYQSGSASTTDTVSVTVNDNGNGDSGITALQVGQSILINVGEVINGTSADETFTLTLRRDQLNARGGNDTVNAQFEQVVQNDDINGGAGRDRFALSAGFVNLTINPAASNQISGISGLTLQNFEEFDFSDYFGAVTFLGTISSDQFIGGFGNDRVIVDSAQVQQNDQFNGRDGDDRFVLTNGTISITVDMTNVNTQITNVPGLVIRKFEEFDFSTYAGAITFSGSSNADSIWGGAGDDRLDGSSGNDLISGGAGTNILIGGFGSDTYIIQSASDTITELAGQGTDKVISSVTYMLPANVENLTLTGSAAINGTGNSLANTLIGNAGNNRLVGGAGNDNLDGSLGADILIGGLGNDNYVVDNLADVVTEALNQGTDSITSSVDWTLSDHIENLTLTGVALNGTGNALNNQIFGNDENNLLRGFAGDDSIRGGRGADTLIGGRGNDLIDLGLDREIDLVVYTSRDGRDVITNFRRGVDGDQLRIDSAMNIDVVDNGSTTVLSLRNQALGFGQGTQLIVLMSTSGFTPSNFNQNLALGNQATFFFA
ncbi:MAG: DUF4347 domain-containing protein [Leptolyngbya sp. Prado105]|jgi:ELWxxDGT repeat protein|nr:DUF4347 domain-containing protein [Leptolyngbya sp. Prado105]